MAHGSRSRFHPSYSSQGLRPRFRRCEHGSARLAAADDVLLNAGTVTDLRQAIDQLHERYLRVAEAQRPGA